MFILMWSEFTKNNMEKLRNHIEYKNQNKIEAYNFIINEMKKEKIIIKNMDDIIYSITDIKISKKIISELTTSMFVYTDGVTKNLDNLECEVKINFDLPEYNNNIYLKCKKNKLNFFKKRLSVFLKMIIYLKGDIKKNNITLYLILTDLKKKCNINEDIGAKNVNSGYTDVYKNIIFIWREEEFEKVSFHELIHFFDKDHRNEKYTLNLKQNIDDNIKRFYESLTDCKAIYYNIIYISILTHKSIGSILKYELLFINNQAVYIQNLLTFKIKQLSSVYSYYILKALIFNYLMHISLFEFNNVFVKNKCGSELLTKIYNKRIPMKTYIDFNSSRMSFFELE